jgi:ribosomal protein L35AE/L33A
VAQMALVVDCRTAHIPGHFARLHGRKGYWRARFKRIMNP